MCMELGHLILKITTILIIFKIQCVTHLIIYNIAHVDDHRFRDLERFLPLQIAKLLSGV
jgi:hypothetical protein